MVLTWIVADQQFPLALQVPNAETRAAMQQARAMGAARFSSDQDLIDALDESAQKWPDR